MNRSARFDYTQYKQKGIAPLVTVIIVAVAIAGIVAAYKGGLVGKKGNPNTAPAQKTSQKTEQQQTTDYSNFENKISIQTPRNWVLKENPQPGTQAGFFSSKEGGDDKFIENVGLSVSDLSIKPNVTLDEIVKAWIDQSKSEFPDSFKVVSQDKTTLGGVEAVRLMSQAKDEVSPLKGLTVFVLKDGKAYILSYSAEEKAYDKFLPDVEKLLSSVKLEVQEIVWETFKSEQYGYSLKYPKGWVVKDQSGEDRREVLVVHPQNMANAMVAARKDDSLKDKASMEKAIAARREFKQSESGFEMADFKSQAEDKKGGWAMVGKKTIDGKDWAVMERGLVDVYGKVLIEQSGYSLDGGKDYKDVVTQVLDSFKVE